MTPVGKGRSRQRLIAPAVVAVTFLVVAASNLTVFVIVGASDAPNLLHHDRVLIDRAAYDLFLPLTNLRLASWADPAPGELVLCRAPAAEGAALSIRRVVSGPGDVVEVVAHRLVVNGAAVPQETVNPERYLGLPGVNRIGEVVARERLGGAEYLVTYTPTDSAEAVHRSVRVPEDHYFVLGDRRDGLRDPGTYRTVARADILGAYALTLLRAE